ncbi:MAG: hypothetical protein CL855_08400 [Cryomorphaceae bacterium]|nr:hypothetical protein [Cryomorphaceae bacterium]
MKSETKVSILNFLPNISKNSSHTNSGSMEKEVNELLKEKFLCQNKFTSDIETLVLNSELNYIEAIITYCEENNIELESVNKLISKPLKEKLKAEALDLNYLKKTTRSRLPI